MRDIFDHFDDYIKGAGDLQQPNVVRNKRTPSAEASGMFRAIYYNRDGCDYIIKLEELSISVVAARDGCGTLVEEIANSIDLSTIKT